MRHLVLPVHVSQKHDMVAKNILEKDFKPEHKNTRNPMKTVIVSNGLLS